MSSKSPVLVDVKNIRRGIYI